jgi:heptosyltransferase-2
MLLMTKSLSSALEARLAGLRPCGYAYDSRSFLLSAAYPLPRFEHVSHAYWHLASRLLGSDAPYPAEIGLGSSHAQRAAALRLTEGHGLVPGTFAILCPFSGPDDRAHRKVWPGFAGLAAEFTKRGIAVVVCPGPGEEAAASALLPAAIRLNGIDLGIYGALQRLALVVVANDTGPGHLAAAVGARLVAVYGPRSGPPWAPLGNNALLLYDNGAWPTVERVATAAVGSRTAGHASALTV